MIIIHLKKELPTVKKKKNNSTIQTKFYQYGNKVSMFETVKEVDEQIVTKDKNIQLKSEPTASLLSVHVEYLDETKHSFIIEGYIIKDRDSIGKLIYDSVFLLNYVEITLHDKRIEKL